MGRKKHFLALFLSAVFITCGSIIGVAFADSPDPFPLIEATPAPAGPPGPYWTTQGFSVHPLSARVKSLLLATKAFSLESFATKQILKSKTNNVENALVAHGSVKYTPEVVAKTLDGAAAAFLQMRSLTPPGPFDPKQHDGQGYYVNIADATPFGIRADHSVYPKLAMPANEYLFAPTMLGAGTECIEVVTSYSALAPQVWAWNWCDASHQSTAANTWAVDQKFWQAYVRNLGDGSPKYSVEIVQTPDRVVSKAYIYNYSTSAWDLFYSTSGSRFRPDYGTEGWDMFESYALVKSIVNGQADFCGELSHTFAAANISFSTDPALQIFQPLVVDESSPLTFHTPSANSACPTLQFTTISQNYHWEVAPPNK